jgi:hypothetical protein
MIDPLETAIKFLLGRAELDGLGERIASKHKYGEEWTVNQSSLIVILDDSDPNWYVQKQDVRLEIWSLAETDAAAMDLWMTLVGLSRNVTRVTVVTSQGNALVYSFLPESGPSYLPMPETELNMIKRVLSFWRIQVSESLV